MDQKLQRGTAASRPLVFRQAADATIPGPHPHCEGKDDRCLTTISSELATSKTAPSVRSSTSYYSDRIGAVRCSLPRVMLHLGARLGLRSMAAMRLCRLELSTMLQHGEHDDGESARERYARLAQRRSPGNVERPCFEHETAAVAGQHYIGGLVE